MSSASSTPPPTTTPPARIGLLALLLAACAGAWAWLYADYLPLLIGAWNGDDFSYGWFIPPTVVWLCWTLRRRVRARADGGWLWAVLWLLAAGALYVGGRFGGIKTLVFVSMWASLVSLAGFMVGNGGLRALRMPILTALFAVPLPPFLATSLSFRLRLVSSALAERMLQLVNVPVFREGNIIDLGLIKLDVVDACSGLRYLFPTVIMALLLGWLVLHRPRNRAVLLLAALPVSVFSNAFRIMVTGLLSRVMGPAAAEGFFHDFSGWLVYMISLAVLLACTKLLSRSDGPGDGPLQPVAAPALRLPAPAGPALVCAALLALAALGQAAQNPLPPVRQSLAAFPMDLSPWQGRSQTLSSGVLRSLGASDYAHATYTHARTGNPLYLLVSWYGEQDGTNSAHAPTSCLLGGGWALEGRSVLPPRPGGRDFEVGQIVLEKDGRRLISNYWFEQRGRRIVNEYANKWFLFWDNLTLGRSDGALVRLELLLRPGQSVEEGQALIDDMTARVLPLLPGFVPGRDAARVQGG